MPKVELTFHRSLTAGFTVEVNEGLFRLLKSDDLTRRLKGEDKLFQLGLVEWQKLRDDNLDPEEERYETELFDFQL